MKAVEKQLYALQACTAITKLLQSTFKNEREKEFKSGI